MELFEEQIYQHFLKILKKANIDGFSIYNDNDKNQKLFYEKNKNNSTSFKVLKNNLILKYHPKKTKTTIEIRIINETELEKISLKFNNIKYTNGELYARIDLADITDIFMINNEILNIYTFLFFQYAVENFGCCSKYIECSNKKKCVHNDIKFRLGCSYKKNLDKNRIFFGVNKNI